jgi:bacterioferritin
MPKASKELLDALNDGLSEELASIIQYMWQHVTARGLDSPAIADVFEATSMVRWTTPTRSPSASTSWGRADDRRGSGQARWQPEQMLEGDLKPRMTLSELYRNLVKLARKEDDPVTLRLVEDILGETEEHAHKLATILEKV